MGRSRQALGQRSKVIHCYASLLVRCNSHDYSPRLGFHYASTFSTNSSSQANSNSIASGTSSL